MRVLRLLCILLIVVGTVLSGRAWAVDPPRNVLVLYDYRPDDAYGKIGFAYAIMLRNLLGHFSSMQVDMVPVQNYRQGEVNGHDVTFYLGAYYDNPLPAVFLADVMATERTVVWFKYNIWRLAWDPAYEFSQRFGFSFAGVRGLNQTPSPEHPVPGFFDTIVYKNRSMVKYYQFAAQQDQVYADPEIGAVTIHNPGQAHMLVPITNSVSGEELPYVLRSGNFWYIADIPFSYIGPRDRYLVLCDLIHDMVNIPHQETHQALVRLEDVSALVEPSTVRRLSDYLHHHHIPFSMAVIPFYRDPLGLYNDGVPQEIHLADAQALRQSMDYAISHGGAILMHGYTHQYDSMPNPSTAISADDYEFWNIVENRPVDEDSTGWVLQRLDNGLAEFHNLGYQPFAWETPHYHGSAVANRTFSQRFALTYVRAVYYTADYPDLSPGNPYRDVAVGQFYPFPIFQDYYGQTIIPENLGNIEYDIHEIDPTSNYNYTSEDIITNARYGLVVRDGMASFFFHPFWLERELHMPGFRDFKRVIRGLQQLGYQFVDPRNVFAAQH